MSDPAELRGWTRLDPQNEVWGEPTEKAPPLVAPAPDLLNTHELAWPTFERLLLSMAKEVDGASDVHLYGVPGQRQDGIDAVGFLLSGRRVVYQAKRLDHFGPGDLSAAVNKYVGGERPIAADRMVVGVATDAHEIEIIQRLDALKAANPDLVIELWDRTQISEHLRNRPDLVRRFFGAETAVLFCRIAVEAVPQSESSISTDAIVRGPIASLDLQDKLNETEAALSSHPDQAAEGFGFIADKLQAAGFVAHAFSLRAKQAEALHSANRVSESALMRLVLGWEALSRGDPFTTLTQLRALEDIELPDDVVAAANALATAAARRNEYSLTVDECAQVIDLVPEGAPHVVDAALFLAEEALAGQRLELIAQRAQRLTALAESQPPVSSRQRIAARLFMCIADASGDWEELALGAPGKYEPGVAGWIAARHARFLALGNRPELAIIQFRKAVERACTARNYEDASDWLYAERAVRLKYGLIESDVNEEYRLAQALRASGAGSVLPEPYSARERALASMQDEKWPDAIAALRLYTWRSTVGGFWADELDSQARLGDLFTRTGKYSDALLSLIRAGNAKETQELATHLPEAPIDVSAVLPTTPWELQGIYEFVAAAGDLVANEAVAFWVGQALTEVLTGLNVPTPIFAPTPALSAFKAFAALSEASTLEEARQFLEIAQPLIPREPNRYRWTDEPLVEALVGIAHAHSELRQDALDGLLACIVAGDRLADLVLQNGADLLASEPELVLTRLREAAAQGHLQACLAIVIAEADAEVVRPLATQRLEATSVERVHEPGAFSVGRGYGVVAVLVQTLDESRQTQFAQAMLKAAADDRDAPPNRREALVAIRQVARSLPDDARDGLFDEIVVFARGEKDGGAGTDAFPVSIDPFTRFRFDMGPTSLVADGLQTAAALARTPDQYSTIEQLALRTLGGTDETLYYAAAHALSRIPPDEITIDIRLLATHPNEWLRALAAVIWVRRAQVDPEIGESLARDGARRVRQSLASGLRADDPAHSNVIQMLSRDPRRSIRRALP